ncbi:hypothetical protein M413DRAFT_12426 [Hebeloma cylindrosporum]|uniref:Uncharacterized protein n=1 Tax=Hebeloma cylindrosporum TaxID=76867 RepID=A0A0C2YDQ6_HEBCY|nr:hypothetical protein M413DRAFT_12426 [Hebeloma cylindrosporum h7]
MKSSLRLAFSIFTLCFSWMARAARYPSPSILVRQTDDPHAENVQYIAYSRITLAAKSDLRMTSKRLHYWERVIGCPLGSRMTHTSRGTKLKELLSMMTDLGQFSMSLGWSCGIGDDQSSLAENCKELFVGLWNQVCGLSSSFSNSSQEDKAPDSSLPASEDDKNHTERDSAKTGALRPVIANPSGVMRRRLARGGDSNDFDGG